MPSLLDFFTPGPLQEITLDSNSILRPLSARVRAILKHDSIVPPPPHQEKTLLDADQVADLLGVSRRWVMARTRAGEIPALRFGKVFRFKKSAIEEWMEECHAERLRLPR